MNGGRCRRPPAVLLEGSIALVTGRPRYGTVHKVLNNNLVVTIDPRGREVVLMGRGLGWNLKVDDPIDPSRVEKTYVLDGDADRGRWHRLLADAPFDVVDAVTSAVEEVSGLLGRRFGQSLPVAIIDHVSFLLERLDKGIALPAAPMPELSVLHPREFTAARRIRERLVDLLHRDLPEEEEFYLTLHLVNAVREDDSGTETALARRIGRIMAIVESETGTPIDTSTPDYARFVLHLKFLLKRLDSHADTERGGSALYKAARHSYPESARLAEKIKMYLEVDEVLSLTNEELLYLIIHLERVRDRIVNLGGSEL